MSATKAPTTTTAPITSGIDMTKFLPAGLNVKFIVQDGILFLAVSIDDKALASARPSGSGKNNVLGSTLGNVLIPGTAIKVGLNVYVPPTPQTA